MKKVIRAFVLLMAMTFFLSACGNAEETSSMGHSDVITTQDRGTERSDAAESPEPIITPEPTPNAQEQYFMSLIIEPVEMTLGESYQVKLEQEIPDVVWSSSNEKVVQAAQGQLKAVAPGNATVTLSTDANAVSFDVTVNSLPDLTLAVNCSDTIELNDAIADVRWESSAPDIVSVENGVITSLAAGASNITVYMGEASYTFEVVATTPDITTTSVRKIIGNTQQVFIFGTNGTVTWKSDNTAIATVSDTGLITAEATGAGQSTVVHAYVDGMEFKIDVAVEPIPQLSSTYKIHGHQDNSIYKNASITLCANANETVTVTYKPVPNNRLYESADFEVNNVLNVADADYSDGMTFPVYHGYSLGISHQTDDSNYIDVYLVGTSQTAEVLVERIGLRETGEEGIGSFNTDVVVTYEPCENYGIIHVYTSHLVWFEIPQTLITVSVDGYQYQFTICPLYYGEVLAFDYGEIDLIPANYMIEECSVDEVIVQEKTNINYTALSSNSRTYFGNNEWLDRIGTKFVEAVEDEAISMAAGFLLKAILF